MNANQIQHNRLLTGYAVGLPNRFRSDLTRHICPRVPVGQAFEYKVYDEHNKFDIPDTRRAEGSEGAYINENARLESDATEARALNGVVDQRVIDASEEVGIPLVQRKMTSIVQMTERETHKRVVDAVDANATAGGTFASASDDFVTFLDDEISAFMLANRIEDPMDVRITLGQGAWTTIRNSEAVKARRSGGGVKGGVTLNELQNLLAFDSKAMISTIITQSNKTQKNKASNQYERIWNNQVILTIGRDGMHEDDNSFIKQFYHDASWMKLRAWQSGSGRIMNIGLDYEDKIKVTNPLGAKKFTVS